MIKVKKQFQGKNVMLRGKGRFTLGAEVDYNTAQMLIEYGLQKYLVKEKAVKNVEYKGVDEVTPTAKKKATKKELKDLEDDRRDSLHTT
jgi:hypothetical protein